MIVVVVLAAGSCRYGNTMKTVAATAMNAKSSRAHTIFKLMVEKRASLDRNFLSCIMGHSGGWSSKQVFWFDPLFKLNGIHDAIPGILTDPCKATPSRNKGLKNRSG